MLSEMSSMMEATEAVDATMNFPSEVIMLGEAFKGRERAMFRKVG